MSARHRPWTAASLARSKARRGRPAGGEVAAAATAAEVALTQATKTLTGHFPIWAGLVKGDLEGWTYGQWNVFFFLFQTISFCESLIMLNTCANLICLYSSTSIFNLNFTRPRLLVFGCLSCPNIEHGRCAAGASLLSALRRPSLGLRDSIHVIFPSQAREPRCTRR